MQTALCTPNIIGQIITELYALESYTFHDARLVNRSWYSVFVITMRKLRINPEQVTLRAYLYAMTDPKKSNLFTRKQPSIRHMFTTVSKLAARLDNMQLCTGPDALCYAIRYNRIEWIREYLKLAGRLQDFDSIRRSAIKTAVKHSNVETFGVVIKKFGLSVAWNSDIDNAWVYVHIMQYLRRDLLEYLVNTYHVDLTNFYDWIGTIDFHTKDQDYADRVVKFIELGHFAESLIQDNIRSDFNDNLIIQTMLLHDAKYEFETFTPSGQNPELGNLCVIADIIYTNSDTPFYDHMIQYENHPEYGYAVQKMLDSLHE